MVKLLIKDSGLIAFLFTCSVMLGYGLNSLRPSQSLTTHYKTPAMRAVESSAGAKSFPVNSSPVSSAKTDGTSRPMRVDESSSLGSPNSSKSLPTPRSSIGIIKLAQLQAALHDGEVMLVDVRTELFYSIGHIPGSKLLPYKQLKKSYQEIKAQLDKAQKDGRMIIFYCAGAHCPDASKTAMAMREKGYSNLWIFEEGWESWVQSGLEQASSYN
jgi:rhodanese-related sulfurtransferase